MGRITSSFEAIVFVVAAASQMTFPAPGAADAAPPALGVVETKVWDGMKGVAAKFGAVDAAPPTLDDRVAKFVDGKHCVGAKFGVGNSGVIADVAATCAAPVAFVGWAGLG